jgi:2-polyprenyl-3-methyl-5-hydroxy-6-metoxy-1,4-benzoquinol methylase
VNGIGYCGEWYSCEEPDEIIANFACLLKRKNKKMRVLDLGCDAGRHQICMAKQGFEAQEQTFQKLDYVQRRRGSRGKD